MTSERPVSVDVTRLVSRLKRGAPTGIDRVDYAYADHMRRHGMPGVAWTPWGARLMPPDRVGALLGELETVWQEAAAGTGDGAFRRLSEWLSGPPTPPSPLAARASRASPVRHALRYPARAARALPWRPADEIAPDAIYLHSSHLGLDRPETLAWLDRRPDVRPVFFIHDLIPIDFPEYGRPGEAERHRRRMLNVGRRAAGIVVNSADVGERFAAFLRDESLPPVPTAVGPLGVEQVFTQPAPPLAAARPYFVLLSTIEARKNHLLILQVWRRLARELGPATPALVVIGRRGWEAESAIDILERCEVIRPHVIEVTGLSTPAVASAIAGARALLMPSFAEGYGIPIVEALAQGTAVLASELRVHREVGGDRATFIDPLDGPGWRSAILTLAGRSPASQTDYRPPTWKDHFRGIDPFLAAL